MYFLLFFVYKTAFLNYFLFFLIKFASNYKIILIGENNRENDINF